MRFRSRGRAARGTRRRFSWGGSRWATAGFVTGPGPASHYVTCQWVKVPAGVPNSQTGDLEPMDWTLVRSRFDYSYNIAATSSGFFMYSTAGLLVWEGIDDNPPNPLDVPWPSEDSSADWIWYYNNSVLAPASTQVTGNNAYGPESLVESKAQRKLSSRQGLLLVVDIFQVAGTGTPNIGWVYNSRHLFKLP